MAFLFVPKKRSYFDESRLIFPEGRYFPALMFRRAHLGIQTTE